MGIYPEWKTKLTYKVIKYLSNPSEIYNSAETASFFILLLLFLLVAFAGIWLYNIYFYHEAEYGKIKLWKTVTFILVTPFILFVGLRGGIQEIPINQSQSVFSSHNILNVAAVNNGFNLYISIFENLANFGNNPYLFMAPEEASLQMKKLYPLTTDSTITVLTTTRPNIMIIILESWSADLIAGLGGEPGITPEWKQLEKEGILFTEIYASGSRSEQGMASIFSGFPAHPISSVTVQPDKTVGLPSLTRDLKRVGYHSSFYFGGQLIYGNIKNYIIFNGFDKIMEGEDFPDYLPEGKLGIHDEFIFSHVASELNGMPTPFLASIFTLSTHSPWDQPFDKPLKWGDNEREYINAAYYTDHCLGEFFREVRKRPWFDSTLFILVADHSHNSYRNWHPHSREYHRIPMLFFGHVIRPEFRGTSWVKMGNQHDLAATLMAQLGISYSRFPYSKDLFNPDSEDFAYFTTEDGVGWVRPGFQFTYEKTGNFFYPWSSQNLPDSVKREGLAYLQTVFSDYMNR
jgi:phosphoglycerol transferase MdoB-like AlkP superfamily enzyme